MVLFSFFWLLFNYWVSILPSLSNWSTLFHSHFSCLYKHISICLCPCVWPSAWRFKTLHFFFFLCLRRYHWHLAMFLCKTNQFLQFNILLIVIYLLRFMCLIQVRTILLSAFAAVMKTIALKVCWDKQFSILNFKSTAGETFHN